MSNKPPEIKDEICICGHLKRHHAALEARSYVLEHGGGRCLKCTRCDQFTWKAFIYRK